MRAISRQPLFQAGKSGGLAIKPLTTILNPIYFSVPILPHLNTQDLGALPQTPFLAAGKARGLMVSTPHPACVLN